MREYVIFVDRQDLEWGDLQDSDMLFDFFSPRDVRILTSCTYIILCISASKKVIYEFLH